MAPPPETTLDRRARDGGFTIPELVVATLILGVIIAVIGAFMTVGFRTVDAAGARIENTKDAQVIAAYLDADVQSHTQIVSTACGAAAGETRLVGFQTSTGATVVYYSSTAAKTVARRTCGSGGSVDSSRTLVRNLGTSNPTVSCDGVACAAGTTPDKVVMSMTTSAGYAFSLAGSRRTFTDPATPGTVVDSYPSWGRTLTILGTGNDVMHLDSSAVMTVNGDVSVNSSSTTWCKGCSVGSWIVNDADGVVQQPLADPLGSLLYPDVSTMPVYTTGIGSVDYQGPGVYRFPVTIDESVTFASGVYVFEEGLKIAGSSTGVTSEVNGTGVFIFNGCATNSPPSCSNDGNFEIRAGASINLTAMTSGTYAGILVSQNRTNDAAATIIGSGSTVNNLDGIIHLPKAKSVTINADSGAFLRLAGLIVAKLAVGSGGFVIGYYP